MKKLFFVFVAIILVSCDKNFESINANPNNPEVISPELLMVNIIRSTVNELASDGFYRGNILMQYAAEIREPGIDRYQVGSMNVWSNGYATLRNVQNLYDVASERGFNNYMGVALVMRAFLFSRMTDCYGALPYSEALKAKDPDAPIYTPRFDPQEAVYQGLIDELKQANELLAVNGGELIQNDILFNGDVLKWKKFANSLRLRLLLRRSARVNPSADMQEMLNDPAKFPLMENLADNVALEYVEAPNLFPITSERGGFFLQRRISKTFADKLNTLKDPRLGIFANPTDESVEAGSPAYAGVRNGEEDSNLSSDIDAKVSSVGIIYYNGQQVPVPAQGIVMLLSELKFILAESAVKGYINGDAKTYYEEGIKASMEYYKSVSGVTIEATPEYLNQPGVAYTPANALELIGTQRWIGLFFNDYQAWHEWKRTGFPVLTPSIVNSNNDRIPVRFLYPSDLQVTNRESYEAAVAAQGPDNINTPVWWDVD
ncbi:SusD/RagB family nutrient-binding outer membrane lipoprotein [Parapedobacter koreensis]|uniref:Starch-binding associating with outer membrane n=1 Tax=Parapedobacter koreensis TaxID=332977 RepID=A0A1H7FN56_9SPHI|nr:SusD/RagB family nutrient-binding outer membrane lipoprotein [Parapedobacter koreensis]SEK27419.1 Starch-binding associating with outer membrane [Parapedobacter koreensis]